jgi:hypothetical protein
MAGNLDLGDTRLIIEECKRNNLLRNQTAYVLATTYWETARTMEPVREAFWVKDAEGWRQRNLRYYPWYGRGYVQITWEANYQRLGGRLSLDLTTDPDVVMRPDIAVQILVIGMKEGLFTGQRLADYITLQASNYRGARRIVNGMDEANAIAELARDYETALLNIGYGVEPAAPVANERRDGTQPRESLKESKTILALIRGWLGDLGITSGSALGWWASQTPDTKNAIYIAAAIIAVGIVLSGEAKLKIWAERVEKWRRGVR